MTSCASLRAFGCLLLLICAISTSCAALDASEEAALSQILAAFPSLSLVQQDSSLYEEMNGPSKNWPSNFSTVCLGPDGYDIHGIYCVAGHVEGIYLYVRLGCIVFCDEVPLCHPF